MTHRTSDRTVDVGLLVAIDAGEPATSGADSDRGRLGKSTTIPVVSF
jgi:hypothetical protein